MQIELKLRQEEPGTANVRLVIRNQGRNVCLDGIVAREARPGWIASELPPLEHWERPLNWLTQEQRDRVESAQFYQYRSRLEKIPDCRPQGLPLRGRLQAGHD